MVGGVAVGTKLPMGGLGKAALGEPRRAARWVSAVSLGKTRPAVGQGLLSTTAAMGGAPRVAAAAVLAGTGSRAMPRWRLGHQVAEVAGLAMAETARPALLDGS